MTQRLANAFTHIVFWEPCVSPHKTAFINALAERISPDIQVIYVAHEHIPLERKALGWHDLSENKYKTIIAPSSGDIALLIESTGINCLHVFSGIRWFDTITIALGIVKKKKLHFVIMSEPRDDQGIKGKARFIQSWLTESWLRHHVLCVLAIGRNGFPWFTSVGYDAIKVYPFAYFLPAPNFLNVDTQFNTSPISSWNTIKIGYVGRLTTIKGVNYLLDAVSAITNKCDLTVIGDGSLMTSLKSQAERLGLNVDFTGVLPINLVQHAMTQFDVLVLPSISKDDGWGAVVSEALMVGVAVVATNFVGASILLDNPNNGRMVSPYSSNEIASAIKDIYETGGFSDDARKLRISWANHRLTALAGAEYFEQVICHALNPSRVKPVSFFSDSY